jgi:hypothetical protein
MPVSGELKSSYERVLKDLETERESVYQQVSGLQRQLRELDNNISSLYRRVGIAPPVPNGPRPSSKPQQRADQKYALISVRWAILDLLNDAPAPMATADIAEALKTAGVKTRAANFTNNVSAVLSTTMREKGMEEVQLVDGKWTLTDRGRSAIVHIRSSPKFLESCPWAISNGAASAAH